MKETGELDRGHIREMTIEDYDAVVEIWKGLPGMGLSSADERTSLSAFLEKNRETCLVMENGGRIVGTVLGGWDGRRGYIYHLAVARDFWGHGAGSSLMDEVERLLKKLGAQRIHLMIYRDNGASAFYEKRGWFSRDDEILIMSKDL